jgi:prepilin-type N-terminal cleavage/methylation domain-containing protein/prepilin-type processing-associated H-X9-DG protein
VNATRSRRRSDSGRFRGGFTIVELLAALAVIGLLLALLLPAVQQSRAAARRVHCQSNLRQIGIAVHSYLDVYRDFPGAINTSGGCLYALLPFVEQGPLFARTEAIDDFAARKQLIPHVAVYLCPDDPVAESQDPASYLINKGLFRVVGPVHGFLYDPVRPAEVTDGLSQTAFMSEWVSQTAVPYWQISTLTLPLPKSRSEIEALAQQCAASSGIGSLPTWPGAFSGHVISVSSGYNHLLPPNSNICRFQPLPADCVPARSLHSGGANVLHADGHARFVSEAIDRIAWLNQGTIDGGEAGAQE